MATGNIDSSTLYEVIHLFHARGMADTSAWTWRCSTEVTNALIHGRQLSIAHTPKLPTYPGPWGYIPRQLADQTHFVVPPQGIQRAARRNVDNWALSEDGLQLLRRSIDFSYYDSKDDQTQESFLRYLENMVVHTWPVLVGPHEIFEARNIPVISHVTGVSQAELKRAHKASKDAYNLQRFASALSFEDNLFTIIWQAYLVDLLVRGRYHDEVASMQADPIRYGSRGQGGIILHHPARNPVLRPLPGSRTSFKVTNTDRAFANILLSGALAERTQRQRIDLWLESVLTARKAAQNQKLDFVAQDDDIAAERAAAEQARSLGIRTHSQIFDQIMDLTVAGGLGYLTSFVLAGWADVAIGTGMYIAGRWQNVGTRMGRLAFERSKRLEHLASSGPGRVEREWL